VPSQIGQLPSIASPNVGNPSQLRRVGLCIWPLHGCFGLLADLRGLPVLHMLCSLRSKRHVLFVESSHQRHNAEPARPVRIQLHTDSTRRQRGIVESWGRHLPPWRRHTAPVGGPGGRGGRLRPRAGHSRCNAARRRRPDQHGRSVAVMCAQCWHGDLYEASVATCTRLACHTSTSAAVMVEHVQGATSHAASNLSSGR
jgi:hypothetical protein